LPRETHQFLKLSEQKRRSSPIPSRYGKATDEDNVCRLFPEAFEAGLSPSVCSYIRYVESRGPKKPEGVANVGRDIGGDTEAGRFIHVAVKNKCLFHDIATSFRTDNPLSRSFLGE
jgi:hypothetical protein